MTTGTDIITQALKKAGILGAGVDAEPEDTVDALADLNDILAQWRRQRFLMYRLESLSFTSTGAQSYTVGPGGDMVITPRPDRLQSAFIRQLNTAPNYVDTPLQLIEARETYSRIALKNLGSYPQFIWYDPEYPLGKIYPWPVPAATIYAVHIQVKTVINDIAIDDIAVDLDIPQEYFAAMKFNLARVLRSGYRLPADPELNALAENALAVVRDANAQIPRLVTPPELARGGLYDIYSDQVY